MLLHRLALRMGRTIRELESSIDREELEKWRLFNRIEPIGDERLDALLASVAAAIYASCAGRSRPLDQCIPRWDAWIDQAPLSSEEEARRVTEGFFKLAEASGIEIQRD